MYLSAGLQVHPRKSSIHRHPQARNVHLRQIDIGHVATVNARNLPSIHQGQVQLGRKQRIDAALGRPGVNEGMDTFDA